jgi:hypothetical protein
MSWIYRAAESFETWLGRTERDPANCSFQRWAIALAKTRDADIVVTGHTHVSDRTQHSGALFLNSGSCSNGRFSFLALDTHASTYDVHASW